MNYTLPSAIVCKHYSLPYKWPYRLTVRTDPSQGLNRGSIPRRVTATKKTELLQSFLLRGEATAHAGSRARRGREHFAELERREQLCLVIRDHKTRPACFIGLFKTQSSERVHCEELYLVIRDHKIKEIKKPPSFLNSGFITYC